MEIIFAPLETPSAIGKCERHGGILKAMVRKMVADLETIGMDDMEMVLQEAITAKNHLQLFQIIKKHIVFASEHPQR